MRKISERVRSLERKLNVTNDVLIAIADLKTLTIHAAEILGLTLNQYKIKLDYALRNFLRVLVELKTEKKGG